MKNHIKKIVIVGPESTGKSTLCSQLATHYQTLWCPEYAREYLLEHGTSYSFPDLSIIAKGQLALEEKYALEVGKMESPKDRKSESLEESSTSSNPSRLTIDDSRLNTHHSRESSEDRDIKTNPKTFEPFTIDDSRFTTKHSRFTTSPLLFIDTDMYVMKVWCEFVFGDCHQWILDAAVKRKYDLYLLCKPDLPWVKDELREYPDLENREKLYRIYKDILLNQNVPWAEVSGNYEERLQKAITAVERIEQF